MLNAIHWTLLGILFLIILYGFWKKVVLSRKMFIIITLIWVAIAVVSIFEKDWFSAIVSAFFVGYELAHLRILKILDEC